MKHHQHIERQLLYPETIKKKLNPLQTQRKQRHQVKNKKGKKQNGQATINAC